MKSIAVTIKRTGDKYIVGNSLGTTWEYQLKSGNLGIASEAGFAQIAASMLTATILESIRENDEEITFTLSVN